MVHSVADNNCEKVGQMYVWIFKNILLYIEKDIGKRDGFS